MNFHELLQLFYTYNIYPKFIISSYLYSSSFDFKENVLDYLFIQKKITYHNKYLLPKIFKYRIKK